MPGKTIKNQPTKNSKSRDKSDKKKSVEKLSNISAEKDEKTKRLPSGYILFTQDERVRVLKDFPDYKAKEVMKELGARWTNSNQLLRDKYNKLAADMKSNLLKQKEQPNLKVVSKPKKKPEADPKNKKNGKNKKTADSDDESD